MASYGFIIPGGVPGSVFRALAAGAVVAVVSWGTTAHAKEPSLTAIELFDGASGPAYVQLADVLINGKAEMRLCPGAESGPMDKSVYGKLSKTALAVGGVLERGADGVLRYRQGDAPAQCVVPQNIKFEHNATFTTAQMAARITAARSNLRRCSTTNAIHNDTITAEAAVSPTNNCSLLNSAPNIWLPHNWTT